MVGLEEEEVGMELEEVARKLEEVVMEPEEAVTEPDEEEMEQEVAGMKVKGPEMEEAEIAMVEAGLEEGLSMVKVTTVNPFN